MTPCLFVTNGAFVYLGKALDTHIHQHHALQLIISLDNPFQTRLTDTDWQWQQGILMRPDQPHQCQAHGSHILFLQLEPESLRSRKLMTSLPLAEGKYILSPALLNNLQSATKTWIQQAPACEAVFKLLYGFVDELIGVQTPVKPLDSRIARVQQLVRESEDKSFSINALADAVALSEGRLVHLFTAQTGIPLRRYLLWERLMEAIAGVEAGENLTQMAYRAGFADSAHFSRTFTRMFGLSPSSLFQHSQFVQARACRGM
jgi:AraC-like DNA-binding protein